jgi:hypothetical protein
MTSTGVGGLAFSPGNWNSTPTSYLDIVPTASPLEQEKNNQSGRTTLFADVIQGLSDTVNFGVDAWGKVTAIDERKRASQLDRDLMTQGNVLSRSGVSQNNILGLLAIAGIIGVAAWAILRK